MKKKKIGSGTAKTTRKKQIVRAGGEVDDEGSFG